MPSNRSGNFELWTVKPDGTGWRQLTDHPAFDACPSWSPDGSKLAFCSDRTGSFQVFTMHADGSGVRQVSHGLASALFPEWSPDGRRIAFARIGAGGIRDLFIVTVKQPKVRAVNDDPFSELAPSWQPLPR